MRTVNQQTPLNVTTDDVRALVKFLSDNQLLRITNKADVAKAMARAQSMQKSLFETVLHNYLFFRLPLLRPQTWLASLQPFLARLNMPLVAGVILLITLLGVFLVVAPVGCLHPHPGRQHDLDWPDRVWRRADVRQGAA